MQSSGQAAAKGGREGGKIWGVGEKVGGRKIKTEGGKEGEGGKESARRYEKGEVKRGEKVWKWREKSVKGAQKIKELECVHADGQEGERNE